MDRSYFSPFGSDPHDPKDANDRETASWEAAGYRIPILYEDNHVLVVVKPPGLLSQGDDTGRPNLLDILKERRKVRERKPGRAYLALLHRLDRQVGGVLAFAKTSKAAARLFAAIRERRWEKGYLAVVVGLPQPEKGTLRHALRKIPGKPRVRLADPEDPAGKEAVLTYETLKYADGLSLLHVRLVTGRPHQIRVQLATLGTPIWGDLVYGRRTDRKREKAPDEIPIGLWAAYLSFAHPTTGEPLEFVALPPRESPWTHFPRLRDVVESLVRHP
ncbi:MAG: RluA family pseudouridine synthase [Brockia lithotrophica]|nr:RluA family pseudouridine synthase [Brockia lithotrophica]